MYCTHQIQNMTVFKCNFRLNYIISCWCDDINCTNLIFEISNIELHRKHYNITEGIYLKKVLEKKLHTNVSDSYYYLYNKERLLSDIFSDGSKDKTYINIILDILYNYDIKITPCLILINKIKYNIKTPKTSLNEINDLINYYKIIS